MPGPELERDRLRELALSAPGPAPWFVPRTTPIDVRRGRTFRWRFSGATGPGSYLMLLEEASTEEPIYALAYVAWSLAATDGYVVSYYRDKGFLTVEVHEVDTLRNPGDLEDLKRQAEETHRPVISSASAVRVERIADAQDVGRHPAPMLEMCRDDEVLLLANGPAGGRAAASVYSWRPRDGTVDVFPQEWFNDSLDLGYQWITGVIRDLTTGHIVGHGIRIDPFELDDSGTSYKQSLG